MSTPTADETGSTETGTATSVDAADRLAYLERYPGAAQLVRFCFLVAFGALGVGGVFGLVQALHRTGIYRGLISSGDYYSVLTAHGVMLVLVFTTFFIVGIFIWAVTRSLERSLYSTRLSWVAVGLMFVGTVMAAVPILAGLTPIDMSAAVLFTFYPPLQASPLFYIGAALIIVGSWIAGANYFLTYWDWRKDNAGERIPLQTFMVLTTFIMWYVSSVGVAVEVVAFLIPWSLGFISQVDPLTMRTLFWYFGHPVVYFWLLPAYLVWYTVLPKLAGGRLFSDPLARVVFVLFVILSTPVGFHHQYVDPGIPEGFKMIAMTNTKKFVFPRLGHVTWRKRCQRLAPSIRAASYSSSGMFWSPARKKIMFEPIPPQMAINMTPPRAVPGSPAQLCSRNVGRIPLITPSPARNHRHMTAEAAPDSITGMK